MQKLVTILIPNYNEIENVKRGVLKDIMSYLKKQKFSYEVIISDDCSTDTSVLDIKDFIENNQDVRIIFNQHAGKPYALRAGIKEAKDKYVLLTDMDQATPITELAKHLPWT